MLTIPNRRRLTMLRRGTLLTGTTETTSQGIAEGGGRDREVEGDEGMREREKE